MTYPVTRFGWLTLSVTLLSAFPSVLSAVQPAESQPPAMVIGFVGGFVRNDAAIHQEVQVATRLRADYPSGVNVRIFANHHAGHAREEILRMLDADHDGVLSDAERGQARIVLYGHSWGAAEAVNLARKLEKDRVPVLLTIQVDSVSKFGENDRSIPANVAQAINFYQVEGLLRGKQQIVAEDPARTRILGNFRSDYKMNPVNLDGFPWFARTFMRPHIEIESDPSVWNQVESLVRSNLVRANLVN